MVGGILERERDVRPVRHLAADAAQFHTIDIEHKRVVAGLGRSLPLVRHRAGTLDGVRGPRIRAVADHARAPGDAVVLDCPLGGGGGGVEVGCLGPVRVKRSIGGERIRRFDEFAAFRRREEAEERIAVAGYDREDAQHTVLRCVGVYGRLAVVVRHDRQCADLAVVWRHRKVPDPAAVLTAFVAMILRILPLKDVQRVGDDYRDRRPVPFVANPPNYVPFGIIRILAIHLKVQPVATVLGRCLPLEREDARPWKRRPEPGVLAVADRAGTQATVRLEEPFGIAAGRAHTGQRREHRRVGGIALHFREFRCPTRKYIVEVGIGRLGRVCVFRHKAVFDACGADGRAVIALPRHRVGLEVRTRRKRQSVAVVAVFRDEAEHSRDLADRCGAVALADVLLRRSALRYRHARDAIRDRDVAALAV